MNFILDTRRVHGIRYVRFIKPEMRLCYFELYDQGMGIIK